MLVASGKMSISQVKSKDMYPRMIRGEVIPHKDMAKKMMALKRENNKKYAKELDYEYATYAFDKCYKKAKTQKRKSASSKKKTRKHN